jgi:hypothetical protein
MIGIPNLPKFAGDYNIGWTWKGNYDHKTGQKTLDSSFTAIGF